RRGARSGRSVGGALGDLEGRLEGALQLRVRRVGDAHRDADELGPGPRAGAGETPGRSVEVRLRIELPEGEDPDIGRVVAEVIDRIHELAGRGVVGMPGGEIAAPVAGAGR